MIFLLVYKFHHLQSTFGYMIASCQCMVYISSCRTPQKSEVMNVKFNETRNNGTYEHLAFLVMFLTYVVTTAVIFTVISLSCIEPNSLLLFHKIS